VSVVERTAMAPTDALPRPSIWPSWPMVGAKVLELRRRRGLMITAVLLTVGVPVVILLVRAILHLASPHQNGPPGSPVAYSGIVNLMADFGFIAAATLGAAAGTGDLTDGMFRHLVITGRSRVSLFLARIPAGLAIICLLVAVGYSVNCLVTSYWGTPSSSTLSINGVSVPSDMSRAEFVNWAEEHPRQLSNAFFGGGRITIKPGVGHQVDEVLYTNYRASERETLNPSDDQMWKIGLWLELVIATGFIIGLGFGTLIGQRTVATIAAIVFQVIITPIAVRATIPHFVNGQRLIVGVALTQLRPSGLESPMGNGAGPSFGGRGALAYGAMPTWAMIAVIAGWLVAWSAIGAWRMATRDA
jgi:hypothetical protein